MPDPKRVLKITAPTNSFNDLHKGVDILAQDTVSGVITTVHIDVPNASFPDSDEWITLACVEDNTLEFCGP